MKGSSFLIILICALVAAAALTFLASRRARVPVHIEAELTSMEFVLADETPILVNMPLKSIEIESFQTICLRGEFDDPSGVIGEGLSELRLSPGDPFGSVRLQMLEGDLELAHLRGGAGTRVEVLPSPNFKSIDGMSSLRLFIRGATSVSWMNCTVESGDPRIDDTLAAFSGALVYQPDLTSQDLSVDAHKNLLIADLSLAEAARFELEPELPIRDISFLQQKFAAAQPAKTTALKAAQITFPTLSGTKPIDLPEGSYLSAHSLRDFSIKQIQLDAEQRLITTTLYGYTNDLRASYGPGKGIQLLPTSLLLLWRNAALAIIFGAFLWVLKTGLQIHDRATARKRAA